MVDADYFDLDERIRLYRNGSLVDTVRRKASFPIDDGVRIEAAVSKVGMKYVRLRRDGHRGTTPLEPMTGTAEAWRARFGHRHPRASRMIGISATGILIAVLVLELPQLVNLAGLLAPRIGLPDFSIPMISLNGWQNAVAIALGGLAGLERGLSMKHHPLLDD